MTRTVFNIYNCQDNEHTHHKIHLTQESVEGSSNVSVLSMKGRTCNAGLKWPCLQAHNTTCKLISIIHKRIGTPISSKRGGGI